MVPLGDVNRWTPVKGELEDCFHLDHQLPDTVTGTYRHLMERKEEVFFSVLHFHGLCRGYLLSLVYANEYCAY